jgi:uncharacterized protein YfbU (UPF0304 family)
LVLLIVQPVEAASLESGSYVSQTAPARDALELTNEIQPFSARDFNLSMSQINIKLNGMQMAQNKQIQDNKDFYNEVLTHYENLSDEYNVTMLEYIKKVNDMASDTRQLMQYVLAVTVFTVAISIFGIIANVWSNV